MARYHVKIIVETTSYLEVEGCDNDIKEIADSALKSSVTKYGKGVTRITPDVTRYTVVNIKRSPNG